MAKASKRGAKTSSTDDSKLFAFLATFLSIIGFIIALVAKKDDKYVMHYAKQSLVVFITSVVLSIVGNILLFIPFIGWVIYWVMSLAVFILWLISWIYALSGDMKEVPFIGKYAESIKL